MLSSLPFSTCRSSSRMLGPRNSRLLSNLEVPLEDPGTHGMNFSSGFRAAREAQKMAKPTSAAVLSKIGQS